jgi:hypothetical protein
VGPIYLEVFRGFALALCYRFAARSGKAAFGATFRNRTSSSRYDHLMFRGDGVLAGAGVRYIRAFSTQGPKVLSAPVTNGQVADQFYSADDDQSRQAATRLISDIGLRPVYVGGSDRINVVDGITRLWFCGGRCYSPRMPRKDGFLLLACCTQEDVGLFAFFGLSWHTICISRSTGPDDPSLPVLRRVRPRRPSSLWQKPRRGSVTH